MAEFDYLFGYGDTGYADSDGAVEPVEAAALPRALPFDVEGAVGADLYTRHDRIGGIDLYCGDCVPIMKALPEGCIDMVLSDIPYGISFKSNHTTNHDYIANDSFEDWTRNAPVWLQEFHRVLSPTGVAVCCCGGGGSLPTAAFFTQMILDAGFYLVQTCIWDKKTIGLGWKYRPSYETILVFSKSRDNYNWGKRRTNVSNIFRYNNVIPQKDDHPTPKPVALMRDLLRLHTEPDMLVLEPFSGGGTTALACEQEGRRCIATELVDKYYDIGLRRVWEEHAQGKLFTIDG